MTATETERALAQALRDLNAKDNDTDVLIDFLVKKLELCPPKAFQDCRKIKRFNDCHSCWRGFISFLKVKKLEAARAPPIAV
jgi:hypothetical protein